MSQDDTTPDEGVLAPEPDGELVALRTRLEAVEKDKQDTYERLLRTAADFDNFRKRVRKDFDDGRWKAREELLRELLPVVDNLERALAASGGDDTSPIVDGVRLVLRQFHSALERFDVRGFDATGEAFDPARHEAIAQVESAELPAGAVATQLQRGYLMGGKLVRPALVTVAKPPAAARAQADGEEDPSQVSRVVGIDLGTTNSCVAVLEGDHAVVIPNSEGSRTTPSIIGFAESSERLVGQIAKRQALTNPENTVYAVKRLMGRKLADSEVERHMRTCPYGIVAGPNGDAAVKVRGRDYAPPELSAMILTKMKQTAEDYLGESVNEAVITVPAYFNDAQRQATKDAGRIAGLEVLRIINEPTAAALAYGADKKIGATPERIAVYDLGGGTFDISILELTGGVYQVKATNGDTFLGGEDFDRALVDWLADGFAREHQGLDLRKDKMALQRLREAAERAKHELSSAFDTDVNLPFITADSSGPKHLAVSIKRTQLEALVAPFIERTLDPCRLALRDAGLVPSGIDQVILVGGQTRMPRVQELVGEFFGRTPHKGVNPDEVVAVGAAIQAGVLKGAVEEVLLLDVTPLSMGVETAGGVFTRLIPRNTTIPTRKIEEFTTAVDNQPFVNIHVLQGEREMAADNKSLSYFQLVGIPPAQRGVPRIQVQFDIDANGILKVAARDLGTGKEQSMNVVPTSGLSEASIQGLIDEARQLAGDDHHRRELAEVRNQLESLMYSSERALAEYGQVLSPEERATLTASLEESKQALGEGTAGHIRATLARLETAAQRIAEIIYAHLTGEGPEEGPQA